jgi:hypothetical protein
LTPALDCESSVNIVAASFLRGKTSISSRACRGHSGFAAGVYEKDKGALAVIGALVLTALSFWIVYEAIADQNEQQMINEIQLGDRRSRDT